MRNLIVMLAMNVMMLVCLPGCQGSSKVDVTKPMMVRLTPFQTMAVGVSSPGNQWDAVSAELASQLAQDFRESLMFEQVTQVVETGEGVPEDQINLMVTLMDVRSIDRNVRWTIGPFAGQAQIVATVEVTQANSGVVLGCSTFDVLSDAMTTRDGTTQDVVGELSRRVVMWVGRSK